MSLVILIFLAVVNLSTFMGQPTRPVSTLPPPGTCQPITGVAMCLYVPWGNASFPNLREHRTQSEANTEVNVFQPLVTHQCSNAIVHFLCAVYTPACVEGPEGTVTLKPCRNLCNHVRNTCEPLMQQGGLDWPPHFECSNFPESAGSTSDIDSLCFKVPINVTIPPELLPSATTSSGTAVQPTAATSSTFVSSMTLGTTPIPTATTIPSSQKCSPDLDLRRLGHEFANSSYTFASIPNCAVPCEGIFFTETERNVVAPAFILVCALICIGFTLFTVGTFMIDRQRYHYPERPVIFLALCYLILSLAFVVGAIVKLSDPKSSFACSDTADSQSFVFQDLPNSTPTFHSASCVILFIITYYFQMAGAIWWVILTLTWFMASTLKWGEEAVERPWLLYHIFAWCIPAILVILLLSVRLVDGDQLSGICYTGNSSSVSMGVFVLLPLLLFLILGIVFLVIGFGSLVHIHLQISKDPNKSRRLQRLIIRILVYALLYIIPTFIYIFLCIYQLAERNSWEESYIKCPPSSFNCEPESKPQFTALLMRYLVLFIIGIFSTFWVISWKTLLAWQKFFDSIFFCCHKREDYQLPRRNIETAI
ncbi:frizzled precursor [Amphimedon queenslandica]|uniref:FzdA n=1 Tax=Amphimedon queenslandica TaxID=400682 RepID=E2IJ97_AMPQE|nr:frizzled precursor [Amphimedon queenslandica]ADO16569.1 FzdA [Amphimedon queenslandica]|eukprot:NP_001266206.1 frizzled precursor [Amphimedon queenslandica]